MKKLFLCLFLICTLAACKKDKEHCYQCDLQNNGTYQDYGCYTDEQWKNQHIADAFGNELDKNAKCRKK